MEIINEGDKVRLSDEDLADVSGGLVCTFHDLPKGGECVKYDERATSGGMYKECSIFDNPLFSCVKFGVVGGNPIDIQKGCNKFEWTEAGMKAACPRFG